MHLEEHEQVEQVAGEEGAVQAHQLELEQRMEVHAGAVPARQSRTAATPRPTTPVSTSISAESRSTTSTMPNGTVPVRRAGRRRSRAGASVRVDPAQQRERDAAGRPASTPTLTSALASAGAARRAAASAPRSASGSSDRHDDQVRQRRDGSRPLLLAVDVVAAAQAAQTRAARRGTAPWSRSR